MKSSTTKSIKCWGVRVPLQEAEHVKDYLKKTRLFSDKARIIKEINTIIFPLNSKVTVLQHQPIRATFPSITHPKTFRENLKGILTPKEYEEAIKGFDVLGTIAIIEIPHNLEKKEHAIATALLQSNPSIKTILKREGAHTGSYRTQRYPFLLGEKTTITTYVEHNIIYTFDVERVYFSGRLSHDRKRIANLVKKGENVLVLFSGCGPYVLTIAKHSGAHTVVGIELNPHGHSAAILNAQRNKISNTSFIKCNANDAKKHVGVKRFDRILMPHPTDAISYVPAALEVAKSRATIHFYDFAPESEFLAVGKNLTDICEKNGWSCEIINVVICGEYSPRVFRVCVDAIVTKKPSDIHVGRAMVKKSKISPRRNP